MIRKAQAIVYKFSNGEINCLCLKRSIPDGGFWHVLTGTVEGDELDSDCLVREVAEELGFHEILRISPVLKKWIWNKEGVDIDMYNYALCLDDKDIILNEEHTDYAWLKPKDAFEKYEKDGGKEMVGLLNNYLFS